MLHALANVIGLNQEPSGIPTDATPLLIQSPVEVEPMSPIAEFIDECKCGSFRHFLWNKMADTHL